MLPIALTLSLLALQGEGISFEEKLIAAIPTKARLEQFVYSPDGRRVLVFADAKVFLNETPVAEINNHLTMLFSKDGRRYACSGSYGSDSVLVIDGVRDETYRSISELQFSDDGAHVAFIARTKEGQCAVIDGKAMTAYPAVSGLGLSADGKRAGFYAKSSDGKWTAVIDGKAGEAFDEMGPGPVRFSPDGKQVAYQAAELDKNRLGTRFLVIDGKREPGAFISTSSAFWSPDSKKLNYVATWQAGLAQHRGVTIVNGKRSDEFWGASLMTFSPDGRRMGFMATEVRKTKDENEPRSLMIIDGVRQPVCNSVSDLTFSPDSKKYAYVFVEKAKGHLILNGMKYREMKWPIVSILFSPDSSMVATINRMKNSARSIMIGDLQSDIYDDIEQAVFSPDGKTIAFTARRGNEIWRKIFRTDGTPPPPPAADPPDPVAEADRKKAAETLDETVRKQLDASGDLELKSETLPRACEQLSTLLGVRVFFDRHTLWPWEPGPLSLSLKKGTPAGLALSAALSPLKLEWTFYHGSVAITGAPARKVFDSDGPVGGPTDEDLKKNAKVWSRLQRVVELKADESVERAIDRLAEAMEVNIARRWIESKILPRKLGWSARRSALYQLRIIARSEGFEFKVEEGEIETTQDMAIIVRAAEITRCSTTVSSAYTALAGDRKDVYKNLIGILKKDKDLVREVIRRQIEQTKDEKARTLYKRILGDLN